MALASLIFMPLGWDGPFLQVMGWGLSPILKIAAWIAAWPGAVDYIYGPPATGGSNLQNGRDMKTLIWR